MSSNNQSSKQVSVDEREFENNDEAAVDEDGFEVVDERAGDSFFSTSTAVHVATPVPRERGLSSRTPRRPNSLGSVDPSALDGEQHRRVRVVIHLGLSELLTRYEYPVHLEVRIDSQTVIRDVWGGDEPTEPGVEAYSEAVGAALSSVPEHRYTHLADSDPNPADALTTVGADIAALGPGEEEPSTADGVPSATERHDQCGRNLS